MRLAMSAMRLLLLLRRSLLSIQPLSWESISLYFTIHEEVGNPSFPEDYEAVDLPANWKEEVEAPAYQEAIETIHHHIRQGDTYQVNYTVQLSQELKSDPLAIYNRLVVEQKPITMPSSSTMMSPSSPSVLSFLLSKRPATDHAPYEGNDAPWSHQTKRIFKRLLG